MRRRPRAADYRADAMARLVRPPRRIDPRADARLRRLLDAAQAPGGTRRRLCLAAAALLFAVVFALKLSSAVGPPDAPSVLYVAPIALAAAAHGFLGGILAAVVAAVLLAASEVPAGSELGPAGMATRSLAFAVCGAAVGLAVRRGRAWAELMRALRHGLDELGEALVVLDEDAHTILHASPGAAAVFRRSPDVLRGMTAEDLAAPGEHARLAERRRMRRAGHRVPARVETTILAPDGTPVSIESAVVPVALGGRRLWAAVVRDVTPRRDAERRLADDHRFLRTVLDTAATPIAVLDGTGRVMLANRAVERLAGLGAALLRGRTPWELRLLDPADVAHVGAALRAGHDPVHHVAAWRAQDAPAREIAWTATAMRDAAGQLDHAVCIGVDITAQRDAEERARHAQAALEVSRHELRRSHRDLGQIVAAASLDLREPLRAAARAVDEGDLAAAAAGLRLLDGLLDALVDHGRLAPGEAIARDVDVEATADAVLRDLADDIARRGAAVTRDPLPVVPGDPDELRALLGHLVSHALAGAPATAPRVHLTAARRALAWELCVAGNGTPAASGHFGVFRRAAGGVGVGLALCRRIAERHGGAIWVDDAPRGGTAVHVTLPDREAR
jgi:PAS domain S-box-containing protein